ncbi:MAG TPA: peptide chain release factor N(5)-glutamine methyltransferase, partial [Candidatus Acidoferrales bacterium]|nr:peptide chain release factor N(5)-glutamine methyltransferase [Candidatus Acidoferrales bacterium]
MIERSGKSEIAALDVRGALKEAMARLRAGKVPSHTFAAELLLMHALGRDRTWIYSHPEAALEPIAIERYFSYIERRAAGEPVQYITGKQEFWGLEFEVTPAVLIPRPETEHIVEVALERLGARGIKIRLDTGAPSEPLRVADVGTGSGCLAVALAHELPHAEIFATDISAEALAVARRNAGRHGVASRVHFAQGDLLSAFLIYQPEPLDLIVSNPPYIGIRETEALPREVREHEPGVALFGGATGIEIYGRLIGEAGSVLRTGGILALELGHTSADHVLGILRAGPCWGNISVTNDLGGIPRVIA